MYRVNALRFIYERYGKKKINYKKLTHELSVRLQKRYNIKLNEKKYLKIINNKNYGEIYDIIMSNLYLTDKKKIWAEKNQLVWSKTNKFLKDLPNPYVIHVLRDPRNVLASFKRYTNSKPPAYLTSIFNSYDAMKNILKNKHKKRFLFVKYEDLLLNPQNTFKKVQNFIGVKNVSLVYKKNNFKYFNKKWIVNSSFQKNIKKSSDFKIEDSLNSFKTNLNNLELNFVEKVCGSMMKKFNYQLSQKNKTFPINEINKLLKKNRLLKTGFNNWVKKKIGFEKFPNDPLNSRNWDLRTL